MRKTILTIVMMLTMALAATAGPAIKATPASKTQVEFKGDSIVINDGDEQVTVSGLPEMKKVRDKINDALDDTLTSGNVGSISIGDDEHELTAEDMKAMSAQWGQVVERISYASIAGLLALVLLVLFFRYLNRRNKYRVMERAIENNYPLNDLTLNDVKRNAIYVQPPVVTAAPQAAKVSTGNPIEVNDTQAASVVVTSVVNWRALMPALRLLGWGVLVLLFGLMENGTPFIAAGLALTLVGVCKGFILYKEQKALEEASRRAQQMQQPSEPMREGIPVPPVFDKDYKEDDDEPYQPY